uniref:huntingtin isoform X3 n=1 Tax=Myxine glutinosa TaxID=7769 RepID=UPI00358E7878
MASMERLVKAFETLKASQSPSAGPDAEVEISGQRQKKDVPASKKEKINYCQTILETVLAPSVRSTADFTRCLGIAIETFLLSCDDADSDVRMVADECLNKVIKTLMDTHMARLQLELYKELKKNGSVRTLRAALWRFAELAHLIRPQKCRPYMQNLLPCLVHIAKRQEEALQETLALAFPKLLSVLGSFSADGDIKTLLKVFVGNMRSPSANTRRTAANCAVAACQNSRRPHFFFAWLLSILLGLARLDAKDRPIPVLLGVLLTLRCMVPCLQFEETDAGLRGSFGAAQKEAEVGVALDNLIQVYEVSLFYAQHPQHNVATAALELLQQLLRAPPAKLLSALCTPGGIPSTSVFPGFRWPSVGELVAKILCADEDGLEEDGEIQGNNTALEGVDHGEVVLEGSATSIGGTIPIMTQPPRLRHALDSSDSLTTEPDSASLSTEGTDTGSLNTPELSLGLAVPGAVGSPASESSQTTEGPDSVITPSDCSEVAGIPDDDITTKESSSMSIHEQACRYYSFGEEETEELLEELQEIEAGTDDAEDNEEGVKGDVGHYSDEDTPPVVHCVRVLTASFLLSCKKNGLISDSRVRVSVKMLSLGCVTAAVALQPQAFFLPLYKDQASSREEQLVSDVLGYISHSDPQLRGATAVLCGTVLHALLSHRPTVISTNSIEHVADILIPIETALCDTSSVTSRLACIAVRQCIMSLCTSRHSSLGMQLLTDLLELRRCSYWLARTELTHVLTEVDFRLIAFLEKNELTCKRVQNSETLLRRRHLQDGTLNVLLSLLGDEDGRVRHTSALALVRLVPSLYYYCDHAQGEPLVAMARHQAATSLELLVPEGPTLTRLCFTFDGNGAYRGYEAPQATDTTIENNLSRIITAICNGLHSSASRYLLFGSCEALRLLSERYPIVSWGVGWHCGLHLPPAPPLEPKNPPSVPTRAGKENYSGVSVAMLPMVLALLSSSWFPLDLNAHQDALLLAGNIVSATAQQCLGCTARSDDDLSHPEESWVAVGEPTLVAMIEQLFVHMLRMLSICAHIIDDQTPGPPLKPSLPTLPNAPSLSPMRKKGKEKESGETGVTSTVTSPKKATEQSSAGAKPTDVPAGATSKTAPHLGTFHNLPPYIRLYDILKATYTNYKVSLDLLNANEKFGSFLSVVLDVLAQLLEIATLQDVGKHAEEILGYLKSSFSREPTATTLCVQQLLKALFGTNIAGQLDSLPGNAKGQGTVQQLSSSSLHPGLYHYCFMAPYTQLTQALANASLRNMVQTEMEIDTLGWFEVLKKKSLPAKASAVSVMKQKADKATIHSYIRLFEPLVIKALKQYTVTTSVALQRQVLNLLVQLVQLRVNYCLLDSDQVFIGFILKQFEFIEEGQINNSEQLIPNVFHFLVLLSYERYHSKPIISMPKIIQLCDGLMASGRKAITHAIPALRPIVRDLFVLRGNSKADAGRDLETQKEVVVSMLLRLIEYHQVLAMLVLVLQQCRKENEDKWKKLSRQVADLILPMLAKQQINLDCKEALGVLNTLFEELSPSSLRPVDILLKALFAAPVSTECEKTVAKWLAGVLAILRTLISHSSEDIILSRIQELTSCHLVHIPAPCLFTVHSPPGQGDLPAEEASCEDSPEETLCRFLFQLVGILFECTAREEIYSGPLQRQCMFAQQLSALLMCLIHMFKSGIFRQVAGVSNKVLEEKAKEDRGLYSLPRLSALAGAIVSRHPCPVLLWCQLLLMLSDRTDYNWWQRLLHTEMRHSLSGSKLPFMMPSPAEIPAVPVEHILCNEEIVRQGAFILFSDYVCQNLHDSEQLAWLIVNHVTDLIALSHEPPVQDCISAIHRNPAASRLFIEALRSRSQSLVLPTMLRRTLQCLEAIHLSQSGAVLALYVEQLLMTPVRVLAHMVDTLACRRVEMLLTETRQDSCIGAQLSVQDVERLLQHLHLHRLDIRHQRLSSLLERLLEMLRGPQTSRLLCTDNQEPEKVIPNKAWFMDIVKGECFKGTCSPMECATLLGSLEVEDVKKIMTAKEFNVAVLPVGIALNMRNPQSHTVILQLMLRITLERIKNWVSHLGTGHWAFPPSESSARQPYWLHLLALSESPSECEQTTHLARALLQFLFAVNTLPIDTELSTAERNDICQFAVSALELECCGLLAGRVPGTSELQAALECCSITLRQPFLNTLFDAAVHVSWVCSLVTCIRCIIEKVVLLPGEKLQDVKIPNLSKLAGEDISHVCTTTALLVQIFQNSSAGAWPFQVNMQAFLYPALKSLVFNLSRLSLVNSYARTPTLVWRLGWKPELNGELSTLLPEVPSDYLRDEDVLREFVTRLNSVGWTSRTQFEESWATLLGVLVLQPFSPEQDVGEVTEEQVERTKLTILAIRGITSLVLSAMLLPCAGNPAAGAFEQQPRNKVLKALDTRMGQQLCTVRRVVEQEIVALVSKREMASTHYVYQEPKPVITPAPASSSYVIDHRNLLLQENMEREISSTEYQHGQISIQSIWLSNNISSLGEEEDEQEEAEAPEISPRSGSLSPQHSRKQRAGVDIHSCSQFLLELYTQWLQASNFSRRLPSNLVSEIVKSLLIVSDLFSERNQYQTMYMVLMELIKVHPQEDEIMAQYSVPAVCKAAAVLGMEWQAVEPLCQLLESTLRVGHLACRSGALHGLLYLLECQLPEEASRQLLPTVCSYLLRNLEGIAHCVNLHNQQHMLLMCATAFYLIENYNDDLDVEFSARVVQLSCVVLSNHEESTASAVYQSVLRGLERLVLSGSLPRSTNDVLVKLGVERLAVGSPARTLAALGLVLTCMYTGKERSSPASETSVASGGETESLIVAMERVSALFDRLRRGVPREAHAVARILPQFLDDFFPPQDVMNKIIGEFLSGQQPYPQLMASVLYKVFKGLHSSGRSSMVRDWVMLSLSNFTQRTPIGMAIWSLSCLFVSASLTPWISSLLPLVLARIGRVEKADVNLFCILGLDFYRTQLEEELDRRAFESVFESVAAEGNAYSPLCSCLAKVRCSTPL